MAVITRIPSAEKKKEIIVGEDLHNRSTDVNNYYVDSNNGRFVSYNNYKRTDYIEVEAGQWYLYKTNSSDSKYIGYYNSNKEAILFGETNSIYINSFNTQLNTFGVMQIPENVKYFVYSSSSSGMDYFELRKITIEE